MGAEGADSDGGRGLGFQIWGFSVYHRPPRRLPWRRRSRASPVSPALSLSAKSGVLGFWGSGGSSEWGRWGAEKGGWVWASNEQERASESKIRRGFGRRKSDFVAYFWGFGRQKYDFVAHFVRLWASKSDFVAQIILWDFGRRKSDFVAHFVRLWASKIRFRGPNNIVRLWAWKLYFAAQIKGIRRRNGISRPKLKD